MHWYSQSPLLSSHVNHNDTLDFFLSWRCLDDWFVKESRSISALLSDLGALVIEDNRHGNHQSGHTSEHRLSPLNTHGIEHVGSEEREDSAEEGPQEGIRSDCRRSKLCGES